MTTGPAVPPRGLRASHVDREQAISALKAAFVHGRLTSDEFDARVGQALAARTHAELAAITADIPAGPIGVQPVREAEPSGAERQVGRVRDRVSSHARGRPVGGRLVRR